MDDDDDKVTFVYVVIALATKPVHDCKSAQ